MLKHRPAIQPLLMHKLSLKKLVHRVDAPHLHRQPHPLPPPPPRNLVFRNRTRQLQRFRIKGRRRVAQPPNCQLQAVERAEWSAPAGGSGSSSSSSSAVVPELGLDGVEVAPELGRVVSDVER